MSVVLVLWIPDATLHSFHFRTQTFVEWVRSDLWRIPCSFKQLRSIVSGTSSTQKHIILVDMKTRNLKQYFIIQLLQKKNIYARKQWSET